MNRTPDKLLNVSLVIYKHRPEDVLPLLKELAASVFVKNICIVDNSPTPTPEFKGEKITYFFTGKNPGYGAGHNIAIRKTIKQEVPYHLVINPDIEIAAEVPEMLIHFAEKNPDIGHIMPRVVYPNGEIQYLCKLLPTPVDLIFRRFLPESWVKKRIAKFELRHSGYNKLMEVPYLSGCFMFFRTDALVKAGMFDERFFMYPEDIDLTRRIRKFYKTIFYPEVTVVHHHEQSSYKSMRMFMIHMINMIRYFNKWGWIFDRERRVTNCEILKKIEEITL
jgi:GT2 family glycosyltransferase